MKYIRVLRMLRYVQGRCFLRDREIESGFCYIRVPKMCAERVEMGRKEHGSSGFQYITVSKK